MEPTFDIRAMMRSKLPANQDAYDVNGTPSQKKSRSSLR
jgi:hypothetical protein